MKRFIIIFLVIIGLDITDSAAQSRRYFSYFSSMQSYFNPALVGLEGSSARSVIRSQWAGIDGAPKSAYGSVEGEFSQLTGDNSTPIGKNAIGLSVLYDQHGPFTETELLLNYTSRIKLSDKHFLGLGGGVKYMNTELDGTALSPDEAGDPAISRYMGGFADMKFLDFNFGLAVRTQEYYFAYAVQNLASGTISSGDDFYVARPPSHNFQAGFRGPVNESIGLIGNVLYRLQEDLPFNAELNFKALLLEKVWLGVAHRVDYSTGLQAGFILDRVNVGYSYEISTRNRAKMYGSTHEFVAAVRLFDFKTKGIYSMW
ncbi:hypothetical protein GCM10007049_19790 [Echinicola pacifica]|uniref:Type IX secretion system membrane protein, PorP/SprF family n=1 Tax=Echinicola pacifica TaxID=346377 RepID=A0A918PZB9_9BACT|nr:type IX secretion system membrane protein PorP/SprF [Echinicola pacifica]GGZ27058.1 hypothetical protein GCM10007049_19790 [Echinicola pacifica]